jgi:hypothetical protein
VWSPDPLGEQEAQQEDESQRQHVADEIIDPGADREQEEKRCCKQIRGIVHEKQACEPPRPTIRRRDAFECPHLDPSEVPEGRELGRQQVADDVAQMQAADQQRERDLVDCDTRETDDAEATQPMGPPTGAHAHGDRPPPVRRVGAENLAHAD